MCIVHVCRIHIDFLCSPRGGGGGGVGWLALYCMYAYGEILTTLFTGLGYARSVSEHTFILMIDTMYTVPIILELTNSISTENIRQSINSLLILVLILKKKSNRVPVRR